MVGGVVTKTKKEVFLMTLIDSYRQLLNSAHRPTNVFQARTYHDEIARCPCNQCEHRSACKIECGAFMHYVAGERKDRPRR